MTRDLEPTAEPGATEASIDAPRAGGTAAAVGSRDTGLHEGWIYAGSCFSLRVALGLFCDYRIFHNGHVPAQGAAILASNHASLLDPIIVGCGVPRRLCFLARDTLFRFPIFGRLIRSVGAMPLPRESASPRAALQRTLEILEQGRVLALFPEGTRSRDGRVGPLRRGIGWLAKKSGAPVVPTRVIGSFEAWSRERILPRRFPIRVIYGKPLHCPSEESEKEFLERLRVALTELGSEECGSEAFGPSWPDLARPGGGPSRPGGGPSRPGGGSSRPGGEPDPEPPPV